MSSVPVPRCNFRAFSNLKLSETSQSRRLTEADPHDGNGEPAEWQRLALASTGGLQRVPAAKVFQTGHRVQIRTSPSQCRSTKRTSYGLLRQHQGKSLICLTNFVLPQQSCIVCLLPFCIFDHYGMFLLRVYKCKNTNSLFR